MLRSPRMRRRALRGAIALALIGAALFVGFRYSNTGNRALRPEYARGANQAEPVVAVAAPERMPLTGETREAVLRTAHQFVVTAVRRERLAESWPLAHPELRQGMTREEWLTGDIPVVPFPVDSARWKVDFSYTDSVGIQVLLYPKPSSKQRSMAFAMELKPSPREEGRWLVSQWAPMGGTLSQPPPARGQGLALGQRGAYEAPVGVGWIFVPIGSIVGILVALPLFLVAREWRRRRDAEQRWREDLARRSGGSELKLD